MAMEWSKKSEEVILKFAKMCWRRDKSEKEKRRRKKEERMWTEKQLRVLWMCRE